MAELKEIFLRYLNEQCTEAEIKFLLGFFEEAENETMLKQFIAEALAKDDIDAVHDEKELDQRLIRIYDRLKADLAKDNNLSEKNSAAFRWYYAAAAILLLLSGTLYFITDKTIVKQQHIAETKPQTDDLVPGQPVAKAAPIRKNKAVLILANNTRILLENEKNGVLASLGETEVRKTANGLIYDQKVSVDETAKPEWNTIKIPRGSQYQITLPDGTRVWLNATTSLTFPTFFAGKERRVQLSGEAYFEVAKNDQMPFKVISKNQSIEVLGTHFNVNAYPDEATINTTLLEGSVKVLQIPAGNSMILKPGQQAKVGDEIKIVNVDAEKTVAWKSGLIIFESADLQSIMRQIIRWYDVEVYYSGNIPRRVFTGKVSRSSSLAEMLQVLNKSDIHCKIEGRRITVMP
jgi:transmembrane sensor